MSDDQRTFSEEYMQGSETTAPRVVQEVVSTTTGLGKANVEFSGASTTTGLKNVDVESKGVGVPFENSAKPHRIVTRARVSHEPQS